MTKAYRKPKSEKDLGARLRRYILNREEKTGVLAMFEGMGRILE